MKTKWITGSALAFLLAGSAIAEEKVAPEMTQKAPKAKEAKASKIADALKGNLYKMEGDKAKDFELSEVPKYFVFYSSASW